MWYKTTQPLMNDLRTAVAVDTVIDLNESQLNVFKSKPGVYKWGYSVAGRVFNGLEVVQQNVSLRLEHLNFVNALVPLAQEEVAKIEEVQSQVESKRFPKRGSYDYRATHNIGTDPEIFALSPEGTVVPAWLWLKGKKTHDTMYADGFAAEFTTSPISCIAGAVDGVYYQLADVHKTLKAKYPKAKLSANPLVEIPTDIMAGAPAEHVELGCMPSENVYGLRGQLVGNGRDLPIRVSGFHIHVNCNTFDPRIVKLMDAIAGVVSVTLLQGLEQPLRRHYYGLPGEYRRPKYGIEYRALSGACLWHPMICHLMFQLTRLPVQLGERGLWKLWDAPEDQVRECLLNLDVDLAHRLIERNRKVLEKILDYWYRDPSQPAVSDACKPRGVPLPSTMIDEVLYKGVAQYIELDVEKNWILSGVEEWISHSESPEVMVWRFMKAKLGAYEGPEPVWS